MRYRCLLITFITSIFALGSEAQDTIPVSETLDAQLETEAQDSLTVSANAQSMVDTVAIEPSYTLADTIAENQALDDASADTTTYQDSLYMVAYRDSLQAIALAQYNDSLRQVAYRDSVLLEQRLQFMADSTIMAANLWATLNSLWLDNVKITTRTDQTFKDSIAALPASDSLIMSLNQVRAIAEATKARNAYDLAYAQLDYRMPVIAPTKIPRTRYRNEIRLTGSDRSDLPKVGQTLRMQIESSRMHNEAIFNYFLANPMQVDLCRELMNKAPERERLSVMHSLRNSKIDIPDYKPEVKKLEANKIHADKWHYKGVNTLQMTQTSLSDNWYKGGENNMSLYSDQKITFKRYDENKITTFESTIEFKNSLYYTTTDTVHSMRFNDNQMRIDVNYGYKAWKNWYYSTSLIFKTPLFNYYAANSKTLKSAFLSPLDLNISVGMDYKYEKKNKLTYSLMVAPLSYNMKYVHNQKVNVKQYGIDEDHRVLNQLGASLTNKFEWKISDDVIWASRLYLFTSYDTFLGEFENSFSFKVNRYMACKILLYPRFDDDTDKRPWQFKEMLTFGFDYVW